MEKGLVRVREFQADRVLMNEPLTAKVLVLPVGVEVNIYGGCLPHIGAVSIADPEGNLTTTQFPTHKDGVVSARWAKAIAGKGFLPVTVAAGIHYDDLTREEIASVVKVTDEMLEEILEKIQGAARAFAAP
ncbi:MAG: hypothetical protein LUC90_09415 [Lachnospiraceae bacterium]|nr:hypothetical protein [Lachnospiraceae bacterium]